MPRVEGTGYYVWDTKDVLIKATQCLCDHPAFVITGPKVSFDVIDVSNDVILIDQFGRLIIVIGKYKAYLATVIPNGPL